MFEQEEVFSFEATSPLTFDDFKKKSLYVLLNSIKKLTGQCFHIQKNTIIVLGNVLSKDILNMMEILLMVLNFLIELLIFLVE